jgi:hypothetical protein
VIRSPVDRRPRPDGRVSSRWSRARAYDQTRSALGDANAHPATNPPTLLDGGEFRHAQPLASGRVPNYSLPNPLVSTPQSMGIEETGFGPPAGTMSGPEMD